MISKMQYAQNRWGCTIFYVDSDGGPDDATAPSQFQVKDRKRERKSGRRGREGRKRGEERRKRRRGN
jgi:hypothetical protein